MPFPLRWAYSAFSLLLGATTIGVPSVQAQLGPELFAITHFFGDTRSTSARAYGMGGLLATTPGAFSPNPAHAAFDETTVGDLRYGRTRFADGTRFDSAMLSAALPLGRRDGLEIFYTNVRSPQKSSFAAAQPGFAASTQDFREESVTVFYGRRVSPRLAIGIGVAPYLRTRHEIRNVDFGAGAGTLRFSAKPPLDDLSHLGARLGFDYQFASWGRVAAYYDNFWEDADFIVPAQLAPLATTRASFHETALTGGLLLTPTRRLTLALERERATLSGTNGFRVKAHNTYYGAQWQATKELALRAGSHDGSLTYGLGWTKNRFSLHYAHVKNLSGDETRPIFGNNTFNVLEASYEF